MQWYPMLLCTWVCSFAGADESAVVTEIQEPHSPDDFPLYLGNPVTVTNLHQQVAARATYIYTSRPLASAAVITTILAYVASSEPVYVQIWRPRSQGSTHTLVGQYLLHYDDAPAMVQVDLRIGGYIYAQEGDCLGFTHPSQEGTLGYTFDFNATGSTTMSLVTTTTIGHTTTVNERGPPYSFTIGVVYDNDVTNAMYTTPAATQSPPVENSTAVPLEPDGRTGSEITLNPDEYILSQAYNETALFLEAGAEQTYLLPEMCLDVKSQITSFRMYAVNNGDVIFQVWRPISELQQSEYMLVASHSYRINTAPGFFKTSPRSTINMNPGDCIGYSNIGDRGILGYHFSVTELRVARFNSDVELGGRSRFTTLNVPYIFSAAITYTTEYNNSQAVVSTSDSQIDQQTVTAVPPSPEKTSTESSSWLQKKSTLLMFLIWLIVLTVLFLACGVCICVRMCRHSKPKLEYNHEVRYNHDAASDYNRSLGRYDRQSWNASEDKDVLDFYSDKIIDTHMSRHGSTPALDDVTNSPQSSAHASSDDVNGASQGTDSSKE